MGNLCCEINKEAGISLFIDLLSRCHLSDELLYNEYLFCIVTG